MVFLVDQWGYSEEEETRKNHRTSMGVYKSLPHTFSLTPFPLKTL